MSLGVSACDEKAAGPFDSSQQSNLVTVVVPCYNGAAFLAKTLTSALAQTHPAIEVIVVDDGSTDASAEISQRFPVRYVYQENQGLSAARNTGICFSKGAYIIFLDADDLLLPQAAAAGLKALQANPKCAIAVGDHAFISADGYPLRKSAKSGQTHTPYEDLLRSNFIEMISSVLFRRSVFDKVGNFSTSLSVAEDYDLYLRIARSQPICCHPAIVAEYRLHGTSMSQNAELMLKTTIQVLKSQKPFVSDDAGRKLALRSGLRSWRRQYGRKLTAELARAASLARVDHLKRKLWTLASWYPQGILMMLLLRFRPAPIRRLIPAKYSTLSPRPRPGIHLDGYRPS